MIKKIVKVLLLLVVVLLAVFYESVWYGLNQARGQMNILFSAKPIEEFLSDEHYPDSLKNKILLVQELREFSFDSLGLKRNANYTTLFDQQGKPILWIVTASEPYELKAKEWCFPILGCFSYKGFFEYEKAVKEADKLKAKGMDVSIDEVEGWSTLGWFKDPILSNMLNRSVGNLANLIIHELTHGTLYVKNNVEYNENLASFVGDQGALIFLEQKYGVDSKEYEQYLNGKEMHEAYSQRVLRNGERLDSLYNSFSADLEIGEKERLKQALLKDIRGDLQEFFDSYKKVNPRFYAKVEKLNNTYFLDYRRYRQKQDMFEQEFREKFDSDFKRYMEYLKDTYPSL
ncbi:aminopeptidase [Cytophagaceae bacterium ABcell3]|nr:aminopeptidase [Cytophagaceae bacterium ABcell3]